MYKYFSFILWILVIGCSYSDSDFYLNETEKAFFRSFHSGDTVYYENATNDLDTLLILKVDSIQKKEQGWFMAKPSSNTVFVSFKDLPINHSRMVIQDGNRFDTIPQNLFAITKSPQDRKVIFQFEFNSFFKNVETSLGFLYEKPITINGYSFSNYYIIECDNCNLTSDTLSIDRLYWSKENGLLAYKNVKGDYWVKISK